MNNILIVGYGYVGSAIGSVFKKKELTIIDPKINNKKIFDFKNKKFDIIFVCVDTPKNEKFKTLKSVLKEIDLTFRDTVICSKSTASPQFYFKASKALKNNKLVFSPEFLSHRTNITDFKKQKFLILGGESNDCKGIATILAPRLKYLKTIKYTDIKTAALVKYSENAFLSLKVSFFNEMYRLHKSLKCGGSFIDYTSLMGLDSRIGNTHMQVPGPDGSFGWGGHCFEKDNLEFEKISKSSLIKFLRKINIKHRKNKS